MFKVSIQARPLGQFLNLISAINGEARFNFLDGGISVKLVDGANVAMGIFEIKKEGFDKYEVSETICIGIDVYKLMKIVDRLNPYDVCEISKDEEKILFTVENRAWDITKSIDDIKAEPRVPKIEFPISFMASPRDLKKDFNFCHDFEERVEISYTTGLIEIYTADDEGEIKFKSSYSTSDFGGLVKSSLYSLDYCIDLVSGMKYQNEWICEEIKVSIEQDFPLSIEGHTGKMSFKFMLAPRIEAV